jgi:hypothetical protein
MEKEILKQRFVFAEIDPYRDYCKLSERPKNLGLNTFEINDNDVEYDTLFGEKIKKIKNPIPQSFGNVMFSLPSKRNSYIKKNAHYFFGDEECDETIILTPYFKGCRRHLTTSDIQIKKHFGRPFSSMTIYIYERFISIKNNKLCVSVNFYSKNRKVNSKFFRRHGSKSGFTIDLTNGNITTYRNDLKKISRVRRNYFQDLKEVLNSILNFDRKIDSHTSGYHLNIDNNDTSKSDVSNYTLNLRKEFKRNLNDYEFLHKLEETFNLIPKFNQDVKNKFLINDESVIKKLVTIFVKIKDIKVPNEYYGLLMNHYPTKPFLKKNENKLISAILDKIGIKSKQTIKLLHLNPNMDINRLLKLRSFFGEKEFNKYLGNLDHKIFSLCDNENVDPILFNDKHFYDLTESEKSNLTKLINGYVANHDGSAGFGTVNGFFRTLSDHFNMIHSVRELYPDTELRSTIWRTFHQEHLNLSKLQRIINRGYSTEFIFDERMVKHMEEPILTEKGKFYPIILKKDIEYTEEGSHMHHCVGSYSENENSLIISLRHESDLAHERITCEFNTNNQICIQAKHFCNALPPDQFTEALSELKSRVLNYKYSIRSKENIKTHFLVKEKDTADTLYQMMLDGRLGDVNPNDLNLF